MSENWLQFSMIIHGIPWKWQPGFQEKSWDTSGFDCSSINSNHGHILSGDHQPVLSAEVSSASTASSSTIALQMLEDMRNLARLAGDKIQRSGTFRVIKLSLWLQNNYLQRIITLALSWSFWVFMGSCQRVLAVIRNSMGIWGATKSLPMYNCLCFFFQTWWNMDNKRCQGSSIVYNETTLFKIRQLYVPGMFFLGRGAVGMSNSLGLQPCWAAEGLKPWWTIQHLTLFEVKKCPTQCGIYMYWLVGGLEHEFYCSIYWECHHPNWLTHIFQRGRVQPPTRLVSSISIHINTILYISIHINTYLIYIYIYLCIYIYWWQSTVGNPVHQPVQYLDLGICGSEGKNFYAVYCCMYHVHM